MSNKQILATRSGKEIYREGDRVVKSFDPAVYPKSDILNEALNQARAEDLGLNVPRLLDVDVSGERYTITVEFIEGKTLAQLWAENPDKEEEYLNLFVDLQLEIQAKRNPLMNKIKDKMNRKIDQTDLDPSTRYELHTRLDGMPKRDKICHGDFNPSNIIVTPEGVPYVLDWAHVTRGNGSADAARTYLLFSLEGMDELAKKYLQLYSRKSGTALQYIQQWMPIVAASQSVKGNAEEREFLMRWVDVVEWV